MICPACKSEVSRLPCLECGHDGTDDCDCDTCNGEDTALFEPVLSQVELDRIAAGKGPEAHGRTE